MAKKKCAYCIDGDGSETVDHIPPKAIFPKPRPNCLITVPSCKSCNTDGAKDDEYFRLMMAARGEANENESAKKVMAAVIRCLSYSEAARFAKSIAKSMTCENVYTGKGIYLGPKIVVSADLERLLRVVERTARGIFFHKYANRIPETHELEVFHLCEKTISESPPLCTLIALVSKAEFTTIGDGAFSFATVSFDGDANTSFSIFNFYETSCFGALITPKIAE